MQIAGRGPETRPLGQGPRVSIGVLCERQASGPRGALSRGLQTRPRAARQRGRPASTDRLILALQVESGHDTEIEDS